VGRETQTERGRHRKGNREIQRVIQRDRERETEREKEKEGEERERERKREREANKDSAVFYNLIMEVTSLLSPLFDTQESPDAVGRGSIRV
jgi:hypothetical protein